MWINEDVFIVSSSIDDSYKDFDAEGIVDAHAFSCKIRESRRLSITLVCQNITIHT